MSSTITRIALGIAACFGSAAAQAPTAPLAVETIRPGVHWVGGGAGANTGILVGQKEAALIDAKMTPDSARAMLAAAQKLTPNPVRWIILTHSDGDHVNGLPGLPKGIDIVAHPNCRADVEEAAKSAPALESYIPNVAASEGKTLDLGGMRIELLHFGPAHTNGDLVVFLPEQKVAFVGDLVFIGRDPLIHLHKHGTSLGLVKTLNGLLALDADTFISGHAAPVAKAEIRTLLASIEQKQAKIKGMIAEGRTLDEIKKEFGVAEAVGQPQRRPGLVEVIYRDLGGK